MREIKFRVWDIEEKRMIKSEKIARLHFNNGLCYAIVGWNGQALFKKFKLIQYTGLKDKNGKKGYHKDIWTDGLHKYLVEWVDKKACFILEGITINREYSMAHFSEGEIIGNIYGNPELVK